jgi:sarcosine oxidase/L-pipecolate oxidase
MSVTEDGTIKFNLDMCFTNYKQLCPGGPTMSVTPTEPNHFTWTADNFPKVFKEKAVHAMAGLYGDSVKGAKIERYRMCWYTFIHSPQAQVTDHLFCRDATTPKHDFLICPHPRSRNLYVATGGSFHGWKFLPVIGDYIIQMMKGTLDEDLRRRWAWDVEGSGPDHMANPTYKVVGNLEDFLDKDCSEKHH